MDLKTSSVLKNYHRVRGNGKPDLHKLMDLMRIIFALKGLLPYGQLFEDHPKKLAVEESVTGYTYDISCENDGYIVFTTQDDNTVSMSVTDIYNAFMHFEKTFMSEIKGCDCADKKECKRCLVEKEWQRIIKSQSISMQESSGKDVLPPYLPQSLGLSSTHVPEASTNKSKGKSGSERKTKKETQQHGTCHNTMRRKDQAKHHKKECRREYEEHNDFMRDNKYEILLNLSEESKEVHILTYRESDQGEITCQIFDQKQEALEWAYMNKHLIKNHFVKVHDYYAETQPIAVKDLKRIKMKLILPGTDEFSSKKMSFFDTGADIASFPCKSESMEPFIHSAANVNGKVTPTIYAELSIDGIRLPSIHEVEMELDGEYAAFGLPQLVDMPEGVANGIISKQRNIIIPSTTKRERDL
ncbi:uncharacterized protein LOC114536214 [Dendronephthya gigantea]|uniref:uncharacterized protein LOC114536214 n=1 Tax=Dendronephthya gigantea TaxID=151771 RepID=UPI00106A2CD6|nr:uncharacterized protein LOC114536214 [Dendronephthya gigantea]